MGRQKYTDEQIINILREGEAGGKIGELCRKYGVSSATYHRWKAKYAGLNVLSMPAPQQHSFLTREHRVKA
jgi:putative transposase